MPLKPPVKESKEFEPMPAGNYAARLYSIIHIGTVPVFWEGKKKMIDKVRLTFEFPTETKVFKEENGEQPFVLSREFTFSLNEKAALRKFLGSWRGKALSDNEAMDTDLFEWIGKEGLINVVHKVVTTKDGEKTYANIETIAPLPKGMTCPPAINEPFILNYYEEWSDEKFNSLPDWLQEKIMESDQYKSKFGDESPFDDEPKDQGTVQFADGEVKIEDLDI